MQVPALDRIEREGCIGSDGLRLIGEVLVGIAITPEHHIAILEGKTSRIAGDVNQLEGAIGQAFHPGHRGAGLIHQQQRAIGVGCGGVGGTGGEAGNGHGVADAKLGVGGETPGRSLGEA